MPAGVEPALRRRWVVCEADSREIPPLRPLAATSATPGPETSSGLYGWLMIGYVIAKRIWAPVVGDGYVIIRR